jgi:hypothetical protein
MATWVVRKYVTAAGKCPIEKWISGLTDTDRASIDTTVEAIEATEMIPPETIKKYQGQDFYEVKIPSAKKALRPFAVKDGGKKEVILLSGAIKKGGKIPPGDVLTARQLERKWKGGEGHVKDYWEN